MRRFFLALLLATAPAQSKPVPPPTIPLVPEIEILKAEDLRTYNDSLAAKLDHSNPRIRERAALAAGRIGDEKAVAALSALAKKDKDIAVRRMAVFALGEIESDAATADLTSLLKDQDPWLRARAYEALGKIAAAMPADQKEKKDTIGKAILRELENEKDKAATLKGLTAVLRARPADGGKITAAFLSSAEAEVRATALNTLARLQYKDATGQCLKLLADKDPVVRANAARVLASAQDENSLAALIGRAKEDADLRVRISAIRSLGTRKQSVAMQLMERAQEMLAEAEQESAGKRDTASIERQKRREEGERAEREEESRSPRVRRVASRPDDLNELLTYATMFGQVADVQKKNVALAWLGELRKFVKATAPEVEIALTRLDPSASYSAKPVEGANLSERAYSSIAQGLAEIANLKPAPSAEVTEQAKKFLRAWLEADSVPDGAKSDILSAYSALKAPDAEQQARKLLKKTDVVLRANAAEVLGEHPSEANTALLVEALGLELSNPPALNDAAQSIISALGKQKNALALSAIRKALDSPDASIQKAALNVLKDQLPKDEAAKLPAVRIKSIFTDADYRRALLRSRSGRQVTATLKTDRGDFTIKLDPKDAPLTVENFIRLSKKNKNGKAYFDGISFHRVVPNFVIQGGDPRGDGNGGPGYQIRCEVNTNEYTRAAVGMALSGKDTGGSQWFVTLSPQPHLDGGYTVFGYVTSGMEVIDYIQRGDKIISVTIKE